MIHSIYIIIKTGKLRQSFLCIQMIRNWDWCTHPIPRLSSRVHYLGRKTSFLISSERPMLDFYKDWRTCTVHTKHQTPLHPWHQFARGQLSVCTLYLWFLCNYDIVRSIIISAYWWKRQTVANHDTNMLCRSAHYSWKSGCCRPADHGAGCVPARWVLISFFLPQ